MSEITPFNFEGHDVRVLAIAGEPWWVVNDVCAVLDIADPRSVVQRLDDADVGQARISSGGQMRLLNVVSEPGLYELIFRSDKPAAKPFRRWVIADVLPAIRRDGGYIRPDATAEQLDRIARRARDQMEVLKLATGLVDQSWLEAKTRHLLARALGEEPEIEPGARPLSVGEYLEDHGMSGAELRSFSPTFGKLLKAEYILQRGQEPMPVERFVSGALRKVAGYTEADRSLFDAVWAKLA